MKHASLVLPIVGNAIFKSLMIAIFDAIEGFL